MKPLRLVALVIAATAWTAALAHAGDECSGAASAAAKGGCCAHASAHTTTAAMTGCSGRAGTSAAARAGGCPLHASAALAGVCPYHSAGQHTDCTVCNDETACGNELRATGARAQVVALRNGAMITYTTETPGNVHALQSIMARYHEQIMNALASGSDATLCPSCRELRGAMQSGKFSRVIVNVKDGCQILLTSSDRDVVRHIHDMTGAQMAARTKI